MHFASLTVNDYSLILLFKIDLDLCFSLLSTIPSEQSYFWGQVPCDLSDCV